MDERFISLLPQQEVKNIIICNNGYKIYVASNFGNVSTKLCKIF